MNGTNLAQNFKKERAREMFDLYIMYIFIGAKVNDTSSKNAE